MTRLSALAITLLFVAACSGSNEMAENTMPPAPTAQGGPLATKQGRVIMTGLDGLREVRLSTDEAQIILSGGLTSELEALSGAVVRIEGVGSDTNFEVRGYSIVTVNGQPVWTGVVLAVGGGYRLDGQEPIRLVGREEVLRDLVGSKIWVAGERDGNNLSMSSYGLIRPSGL